MVEVIPLKAVPGSPNEVQEFAVGDTTAEGATKLALAGGTMTGDIDMDGHSLTNVNEINGAPVIDSQVTTGSDGMILEFDTGVAVDVFPREELVVAIGDETSDMTASTSVPTLSMRAPFAMTLSDIKGSVGTAPTGASAIFDVHLNGTTIMTTNKITIESTELTSRDATTAPTLTTTAIAEDDLLEFFVDQIGSSVAGAGPKVTLIGRRA